MSLNNTFVFLLFSALVSALPFCCRSEIELIITEVYLVASRDPSINVHVPNKRFASLTSCSPDGVLLIFPDRIRGSGSPFGMVSQLVWVLLKVPEIKLVSVEEPGKKLVRGQVILTL